MTGAASTANPDDPAVITGMGLASAWGIGQAVTVLTAPPQPQPTADNDGVWRIPDSTLAPDTKRVADLGGDRAALLAVPAIRHALDQASFDLAAADATRVGLVLGSVFAALADMLLFAQEVKQQTPRFVSPLHFPQTVGNYAAGALARIFKINGPNLTFGAGPQAGLAAVAEAAQLVQVHRADLILAGGTDTVSPNLLPAMIDAAQVRPGAPFASQLAEGACFLALELESRARARGANILARIIPPNHQPSPAVLSGHFSGQRSPDQDEAAALLDQAQLTGPEHLFLSSRHLLANGFAATAAAQLALAVAALQQQPVPLWRPETTDCTARPDPREASPLRASAALAVSNPDQAGQRTVIHLQAP